MKTIDFFECRCGSDDHLIKVIFEEENGEKELSLTAFLYQYNSFWQRLKLAVKYLFGCPQECGHWDYVLLKDEDVDKLICLLQKYKNPQKLQIFDVEE